MAFQQEHAEDPGPSLLHVGAVVVDAVGGDHGAPTVLAGVRAAADRGVPVIACGPEVVVDQLTGVRTYPSGDAVAMAEDPAIAMRRDPPPSVRTAARVAARSHGAGLVSAGPSGATVAAALLEMGRLPGVRRPVLAARLPCRGGGHVVLVDAGAMLDPRPEELAIHARLGRAYARALGTADPTVGLLNIGHEHGKGDSFARACHEVLAGTVGFVGNTEPQAVADGAVDVVVTDAFTGNILLKTVEAFGPPDAQGDRAALVLGVRGTVLVAHGAADAGDIEAAILMAARVLEGGLDTLVADALDDA